MGFAAGVIKPDASNNEYTACSARNQSVSCEPEGRPLSSQGLQASFCYKLMPILAQEIGHELGRLLLVRPLRFIAIKWVSWNWTTISVTEV